MIQCDLTPFISSMSATVEVPPPHERSPRCDSCGRFMRAFTVVERWTEHLDDGPDYDEEWLCPRCAP